jgi:hypothetical protein
MKIKREWVKEELAMKVYHPLRVMRHFEKYIFINAFLYS